MLMCMCSLQLWSSKWNIKDEQNKLLNELGGAGGTGNSGTTGNGASGGANGGGGGAGNNTSGYYEHSGFPGNAIATSAELYDSLGSISTMTQAQTPHLYTPPIGGTIGEYSVLASPLILKPTAFLHIHCKFSTTYENFIYICFTFYSLLIYFFSLDI